jgi:tryptophan synthase alpha chain
VASARGFVYVVSVTGVTGERRELPPRLAQVVDEVRAHGSAPVAVGFGIGTPAQAGLVGEIADGVIIGSRLVRELAEAQTPDAGLEGIDRFLEATAAALRGGGS